MLALLARHHLDSFHFARGDRKLKRLLCHKLHPVGGVDRKSPYSKTSKGFKAEIRHNQTLEKNRLTTNSVPAGLSKLTKKKRISPKMGPVTSCKRNWGLGTWDSKLAKNPWWIFDENASWGIDPRYHFSTTRTFQLFLHVLFCWGFPRCIPHSKLLHAPANACFFVKVHLWNCSCQKVGTTKKQTS